MATVKEKIWQMFDAKALAMYWTDVNSHMNDPYIGGSLFPSAKRTGLDLAWIRGVNNLPVALQPAAFDTKAPLRDRIGVTKIETEMPFFREAMRIGEKDRQDIQTYLAAGDQFAAPIIQRLYDDTAGLIDGANIQPERMIMSLLYQGKINITASVDSGRDVTYNYNYDVDGTWASNNNLALSGTDTWTKANAATNNPIGTLLKAKEYMAEKYGVTVTRALMNTATLKNMLLSESIKKAMNPLGASSIILTTAQAKAYVETETVLTIMTYDKMFKNEEQVDTKFYPDNYVTLLPGYSLGNTWYGTTPEEFDLMTGNTDASVSIVNTGVAVTTYKEPHPVNVVTVVSEIVLPSFERMSDVYVIKVA